MTNTRAIRARLGLTQRKFAERYDLKLSTLWRWERGRSVPSDAAETFLRLIEHSPQFVASMLETMRRNGADGQNL